MSVAIELDPIFVKALKFLQSKAKDSGAQLKSMLDDAIAQRKGLKLPSQSGDAEKSSSKSRNEDDIKKREADKRSADKSVKDSSEPDHKKAKVDQSKQKSSSEREAREKEKERERSKREREKKEKEEKEAQKQKDKAEKERKEKESLTAKPTEIEIPSDEEEQASQMDAGDFALEMGIACVVCKRFDVSSGNQLVECQECGTLYHQECHKPSVTGDDVSDPRFVWYCSKCTKSLKKMVTQKPSKPKASLPVLSTKESSSSSISKPLKPDSTIGSQQAFRKIDPKAIVTPKEIPTSSSTKPMVGLAGLAANLAKPRGDSKNAGSMKKSDQKGDAGKSSSSSKVEGKSSSSSLKPSSSSSKPPTSSSSSSTSKSENRKYDSSKSSSSKDDNKEKDRKSDTKVKSDDRRPSDSSSSSSKDEKKSDSKGSEKKSESGKPPSQVLSLKTDLPSSSPPQSSPSSPSLDAPSSKGNSSNKQAVANLSMVTANKRIQMMKKKAQAKPQEKKVHIK